MTAEREPLNLHPGEEVLWTWMDAIGGGSVDRVVKVSKVDPETGEITVAWDGYEDTFPADGHKIRLNGYEHYGPHVTSDRVYLSDINSSRAIRHSKQEAARAFREYARGKESWLGNASPEDVREFTKEVNRLLGDLLEYAEREELTWTK